MPNSRLARGADRPAHGDRAGLVDRADLLGVTLKVPAHQREVLVDPDEHTAAVELASVATAYDDERLLVLASHRIEEFGAVVAATLPVGPDEGDGTRVLVVVRQVDVGSGERRAMPRGRCGTRRSGGRPNSATAEVAGAKRARLGVRGKGRPRIVTTSPSSRRRARSNHTWTWPVPMEFSYSEYMASRCDAVDARRGRPPSSGSGRSGPRAALS